MSASLLSIMAEGGHLWGTPHGGHVTVRRRSTGCAVRVESLETRSLFCGVPGATLGEGMVGPVLHERGGEVVMPAARGAEGGGQGSGIVNSSRQIVPLNITSVVREGNQLVARGLMGDQPFTAPMTLTATPNPADPDCPILNLELGPIHLDLLGLIVDTSRICLDIEADPDGGILGNLLCGIANLLNTGTPLGTILDDLGANVNQVLTGLTNVLDTVFDRLTGANAITGVSGTGGPSEGGLDTTCDILNLEVGPLDLNLLGLEIELDNCANGPVTLDITAEEGPGNLLGNLLCGLAGLLDNPDTPPGRINSFLNRVRRAIGDLV